MGGFPWRAVLGTAILLSVLATAIWRLGGPFMKSGTCDLSSGPCSVSLGGQQVEVELSPLRPRPDEEMLLKLRLAGDRVYQLSEGKNTVDFTMPGMDMGEHRMTLAISTPKLLEGRITLPSCPMGHSLWQASIRLSELPMFEVNLHVGE